MGSGLIFEETDFPAHQKLERAKGFEPSTPTLARLCSTPELRPLEMAADSTHEADRLR